MFKIILGKLQKIKLWFIKLGFWKKLIILFTINTLVILIVMNILMGLLFNDVSTKIKQIAENQKQQFIQLSNSQVAQSTANLLTKAVESYGQYIIQVANNFKFFSNNPNIYISLQSGIQPFNPPLTSSFSSTNFSTTGIYFNQLNSTFYNRPFTDIVLSNFLTESQFTKIKRMNVIYQSLIDQNDIFIRTFPGTNDFVIKNVQDINERFNGLYQNYLTAANVYTDTLTMSENPGKLIAVRTLQMAVNKDYRKIIQVQVFQQTIASFLSNIFYFPSAQNVLLCIQSNSPFTYNLINIQSFHLDLTNYLNPGSHQLIHNQISYKLFTIAINDSFIFGSSAQISSTQPIGPYRLILVVQKQELVTPDTFMNDFLSTQSSTLTTIIYGWSFVILISTIGLTIVTGNYIFYNLTKLSEKLSEYTLNPGSIHKIIFDLKQLQTKGIIKKLIDNIITIIQKIQERKKNKNKIKNPIDFPLNIAQKNFLQRQGINQTKKIQEFKKLLIYSKLQKHKIQ